MALISERERRICQVFALNVGSIPARDSLLRACLATSRQLHDDPRSRDCYACARGAEPDALANT
jgi:hypothetical protein